MMSAIAGADLQNDGGFMKNARSFLVLWAGACAAVTGCAAPDSGNPFDANDFVVPFETAEGPNGSNGDRGSCFGKLEVHDRLYDLAQASVNDNNSGVLPVTVGDLGDCTQIVSSAIMCALRDDQVVMDPVTGEYFRGWWGLAPDWETNALDLPGQRWVTACMIQRLNYFGASVDILLEGATDPILQNATLNPQYQFEESTAFGNYFLNEPELYMCWEHDIALQCDEDQQLIEDDLDLRVCDDSNANCGLQQIGYCTIQCQQSGPYWRCPGGGTMYDETIRVQLQTYGGYYCQSP